MNETPTRADLIVRLTTDLGYDSRGAELLADKLASLQPKLHLAFAEWWKSGTLPDTEVEGITSDWLMQNRGLKPLAALLTLDWLVREPKMARAAIERGHDRIGR